MSLFSLRHKSSCVMMHLNFLFQTLDAVFEILDYNEKGELDYSMYMMAVIGCMVEARKALVRKVSVFLQILYYLTHLSLASYLWDIGKQHSPICDNVVFTENLNFNCTHV